MQDTHARRHYSRKIAPIAPRKVLPLESCCCGKFSVSELPNTKEQLLALIATVPFKDSPTDLTEKTLEVYF